MEMKCIIKVYEYQNSSGSFTKLSEVLNYEDINMSAKQLFEKVMMDKDDLLKNKFFVMEVNTIDDMGDTHNFYTIRTDLNSKITEINIAGPNVLDKSMLIDAIVGCTPTSDLIPKGFISMEVKGTRYWVPDIKERLEKMNILRLKEMYQKLKS